MTLNKLPKDFAKVVCSNLEERVLDCPKMKVLTDLFELMYFASLKTEEQQPITFHIIYIDPKNPDPDPPRRIVRNRWSYVRFAKIIPVTIANLLKIAKASDPRTSSLAIYSDSKDKLFIWGLIDQGNRYHNFINYDDETGPERPGIFQASIAGVGHLIAYKDYLRIAELKINIITQNPFDVLTGGPIYKRLRAGISDYIEKTKNSLRKEAHEYQPSWNSRLVLDWISSLCRILLRIQNYKHGGAIIITPDKTLEGLSIKYEIEYSRLKDALENHALMSIKANSARRKIIKDYLHKEKKDMPVSLYLDRSVSNNELIDTRSEIEGTIWFISLLSRVDGLILMNPSLEVKGFGVEITVSDEPSEIFIANTREGTKKSLKRVEYDHYGTRHRSMMRYCSKVDNSIGFVISQDGDVRVMTNIDNKLILWENIKLQKSFEVVK